MWPDLTSGPIEILYCLEYFSRALTLIPGTFFHTLTLSFFPRSEPKIPNFFSHPNPNLWKLFPRFQSSKILESRIFSKQYTHAAEPGLSMHLMDKLKYAKRTIINCMKILEHL